MRGLVLLPLVALTTCHPTGLLLLGGVLNGLSKLGGNAGGGVTGGLTGGGHGGVGGGLTGGAPGGVGGGLTGGAPGGVGGGLPVVGGLTGALGGLTGGLIPGQSTGALGGLKGPGGRTDRGYLQRGGVYPVQGGGLFGALAFLSQGLTDIVGNAGSILEALLRLDVTAVIDNLFDAVISVGRAAGGIVNALIPGLGTLLGNLVVSIGKIAICVLGSPGLVGAVFGRSPGKDNPVDIPDICSPKYGKPYGFAYDGPYDRDTTIIRYYKVKNAERQAMEYINKYTKGRGINGLTGSTKIVAMRILTIARIMDKGSDNWTRDDLINVVLNIIIINGVLGESYQPGLGVDIVNQWFDSLKKNKKFSDIYRHRAACIAALNGAKENRWGGAFDLSKRRDWNKVKKTLATNQSDDDNSDDNSDDGNSNDSDNDNGSADDEPSANDVDDSDENGTDDESS